MAIIIHARIPAVEGTPSTEKRFAGSRYPEVMDEAAQWLGTVAAGRPGVPLNRCTVRLDQGDGKMTPPLYLDDLRAGTAWVRPSRDLLDRAVIRQSLKEMAGG